MPGSRKSRQGKGTGEVTRKKKTGRAAKPLFDVENLAACIHTALRKGVDARSASEVWSAIANCEVWGDAVRIGCDWAGLSRHVRVTPNVAAVPLYVDRRRRGTPPLGQRTAATETAVHDAARFEVLMLVGKLAAAEKELRGMREQLAAVLKALDIDDEPRRK